MCSEPESPFGILDDQSNLTFGEALSDAHVRPASERDPGVCVSLVLGTFGAEAVRIEFIR